MPPAVRCAEACYTIPVTRFRRHNKRLTQTGTAPARKRDPQRTIGKSVVHHRAGIWILDAHPGRRRPNQPPHICAPANNLITKTLVWFTLQPLPTSRR